MSDDTTLPRRGVKRLLRGNSEMNVSENAVENLLEHLEQQAEKVSQRARDAARHDDRRTIQEEDVQIALDLGV